MAVPFSRKLTSSFLDCRLSVFVFFNRYQTFAVASISTPSIRVIPCNKGGYSKSIYFRRRSTGQVLLFIKIGATLDFSCRSPEPHLLLL